MNWRPAPIRSVGTSFNSRSNSIGFFRWLMAFAVIFSHAGPVAGLYGQEDLGASIGGEQSLGGVAVAGFFFFSGYLITRSRDRTGLVRYLWRRTLRIMPAFWAALLLTAFVLAPIAWRRETGSWGGFWDAPVDSPFTYVSTNLFLQLDQRNIAQMGGSLPFAKIGGYDWNGSAWTLEYEFMAYLLVGLLGLLALAGRRFHRVVATAVAVSIILVNSLMWSGHITPWGWPVVGQAVFSDVFIPTLLAPFAFGMLVALWSDYVPVSGPLAIALFAAAFWTYTHDLWTVIGQFGFLYFLMWGAVRFSWVRGWERYGDFSYGVYIFAWPLMTFACFFGVQEYGAWVYLAVIVVATHAVAYVSWHLIEKPAMSLKDWSPYPALRWVRDRVRPDRSAHTPTTEAAAVVSSPTLPVPEEVGIR